MDTSTCINATEESAALIKNSKVKHLYDQIKSIKGTICMSNGDRPELWIQRQNLQDLYHQIILNDIDFTIDKKLEQDLWNLVFKSQINYFQNLIKENRSSATSAPSSHPPLNLNTSPTNTKGALAAQKRIEAQASLFFFLEAARGFYTKLLEDIVLIYDFNELVKNTNDSSKLTGSNFLLPFCQRFPSIFDKINSSNFSLSIDTTKEDVKKKPVTAAQEKQILYICQHILTHLGDIARYANLFQQAKNYYLHAIKLVPYLGHPYNQLGILFETSRTNQLSTIFYYVRSVACRYNFPLASTNLENFFKKLVDVPLTRYNPSLNNLNSINNLLNNTEPQLNLVVKLSHKDLITLYLQINALIYYLSKSVDSLPTSIGKNSQRINSYIELFKTSFMAFVSVPLQREKLDSLQINQMLTVLIFLISQSAPSNGDNKEPSNNELKQLANSSATNLFVYLLERLINLNEKQNDDLSLSPLYTAFNFIENYEDAVLMTENKLWEFNKKNNQIGIYNFVNLTAKTLNNLNEQIKLYEKDLSKFEDYPLSEDKMLDSFLPLKKFHSKFNFPKYMRNLVQPLNSADETVLRKRRIINFVTRLLSKEDSEGENKSFLIAEKTEDDLIFKVNTKMCPIPLESDAKEFDSKNKNEKLEENIAFEFIGKSETENRTNPIVNKSIVSEQIKQPVPQQQRKRRQIVAIHSLTQNKLQQEQLEMNKVNIATPTDMKQKQQNSMNIQPIQMLQQHIIPNNQMNHSQVMQHPQINNNIQTRKLISNPMQGSYGQNKNISNQPLLNDPQMFQNNMNNSINRPLMRQMPLQQQQQQSFFPSASQRQFQQPELNQGSNFNQNFSNFMPNKIRPNTGSNMIPMMGQNMMQNMAANYNYPHQNIQYNNMMNPNMNFPNQLNKNQNIPNNDQQNNFFQQNQKMYMQKMSSINIANNQQIQQQQNNQFNFQNFPNQQQAIDNNMRLGHPQQIQPADPQKLSIDNNLRYQSYFDQSNKPTEQTSLPVYNETNNIMVSQYKNINKTDNKTDLIDRLASSKSLGNIWSNDNKINKSSKNNTNSIQNSTEKSSQIQQNFVDSQANELNKLRIGNIFNESTTESNPNNNGILTNILQQISTNLIADNNKEVDLATISLPDTDEIVDTNQNAPNSSIWSFSDQNKEKPTE